MNKYLKPLLFIILLGIACPLYAQSAKVITLKDGSVIKGTVTQLADGIYIVDELLQNELNEGQQVTVAGIFRRICKHPDSGCIDRLVGDEKFFIIDIDDSIIPKKKILSPSRTH